MAIESTLSFEPQFRLIQDDQLPDLESLIAQEYGLPTNSKYLEDFPVWVTGSQLCRMGAFDGNRLVSAALGRFAYLRTSQGRVPMLLVGGVVTDASYQKRGLAKKILLGLEHWARKKGACAMVLWGNENPLYESLGFEFCGLQGRAKIEDLALQTSEPPSSEAVREGYAKEIFEWIRQERGDGLSLTGGDEVWFRSHRNVNWLTLWNGAKLDAFIGYGRGVDLSGIVHEFGGRVDGVRHLVQIAAQREQGLQWMFGAAHLRAFSISDTGVQWEYACQMKILDADALCRGYGLRLPSTDDPSKVTAKAIFGPESDHLLFPVPIQIWFYGLDAC